MLVNRQPAAGHSLHTYHHFFNQPAPPLFGPRGIAGVSIKVIFQ